jgi:hypothetical protein
MSSAASDPPTRAKAVTPSDDTVVGAISLYIGGTGNVAVVLKEGDAAVTFNSVPVGILRVSAYKVMATNTTATNIVALY